MGLLSGDSIQALFGGILSAIYEDAVIEIWGRADSRDPETGTYEPVKVSETPCKVQKDKCTEAQRQSDGYSVGDVRFMILQSGMDIEPDSDSRVLYRGQTYHLHAPIEQDPARVYWDARARLVKEG